MCLELKENFPGLHLSIQRSSGRQTCISPPHSFPASFSTCVSFLLTINYHLYHFLLFFFFFSPSWFPFFSWLHYFFTYLHPIPCWLTTFSFYSSTCRVPPFSVSVFSLFKSEDLIDHQPHSRTEHLFLEEHSLQANHRLPSRHIGYCCGTKCLTFASITHCQHGQVTCLKACLPPSESH